MFGNESIECLLYSFVDIASVYGSLDEGSSLAPLSRKKGMVSVGFGFDEFSKGSGELCFRGLGTL